MKRKSRAVLKESNKGSIGYAVRKYRLMKGLSSAELSEKTGYTSESILQIERDMRNPKIESRLKIAEALEINPLYLFPELTGYVSDLPEIKTLQEYSSLELLEEVARRIKKANLESEE
jgi:transcriptional regulator with XRE-family HTH domain